MRVKTSSVIKIIALIIVVYSVVTLVTLQNQISVQEAQAAELSASISAAQQTNERLLAEIDRVGSTEGVTEIARNKLGLVSEGEIVFFDVGN